MSNGISIEIRSEEKKPFRSSLVHYLLKIRLIKNIYHVFIKPRTRHDEYVWQEISFNILLIGSIILLFILGLTYINSKGLIDLPRIIGIGSFLILMLGLSRYGYYKVAMYTLLISHLLAVSYSAYYWTISAPEVILGFSTLITITGLLIGRPTTIALTIFIVCYMSILGYIQKDGLQYSIMFLIVMLVCYLSRCERAEILEQIKSSEAALKAERDELAIKIREGKKKLKATELERMSNLYRFAEFGKLSSGLFHDLINPLTAMSLYLDDLVGTTTTRMPTELKKKIETALSASKRMEDFIMTIRKQLAQASDKKTFSVKEEITQAIELLSHRAAKEHVTIEYKTKTDVYMYGNPMRFYQVALNLISNAIDAYRDVPDTSHKDKQVHVHIHEYYTSVNKHVMELTVRDYGIGIEESLLNKIFEPFFTTKDQFFGSGIGLSTTKGIIEKDFGGHIQVHSIPHEGTLFTVSLPIIEYS